MGVIAAHRPVDQTTRLRQARESRNWTLRRVIEEIELLADRPTGLTESLVSQWERGKVRPSMHYRGLLCEVYAATPHDLGFQGIVDANDNGGHGLQLVTSHDALLTTMMGVVSGAEEVLAVTGSRSREATYLGEIERALTERPRLVHYRILFGPPRRQVLKDHLVRLVELRNPLEREASGIKRLYLGIVDDLLREPERFIVASERVAVLGIPSLVTAGNFDTGVVFHGPSEAQGFVQHVKQIYAGTRQVESLDAVCELPVVP